MSRTIKDDTKDVQSLCSLIHCHRALDEPRNLARDELTKA